MTEELKSSQDKQAAAPSCEPSMSRAEFITRVVKGAALAGGLVAAPQILDKFLVPAAFAAASASCVQGTPTVNGGLDVVQLNGNGNFYVVCNSGTGSSQCAGNTDIAAPPNGTFSCP